MENADSLQSSYFIQAIKFNILVLFNLCVKGKHIFNEIKGENTKINHTTKNYTVNIN